MLVREEILFWQKKNFYSFGPVGQNMVSSTTLQEDFQNFNINSEYVGGIIFTNHLPGKLSEICNLGWEEDGTYKKWEWSWNFQLFLYVYYATDVTFQESNRPSGILAERKRSSPENITVIDIKLKYLSYR